MGGGVALFGQLLALASHPSQLVSVAGEPRGEEVAFWFANPIPKTIPRSG